MQENLPTSPKWSSQRKTLKAKLKHPSSSHLPKKPPVQANFFSRAPGQGKWNSVVFLRHTCTKQKFKLLSPQNAKK